MPLLKRTYRGNITPEGIVEKIVQAKYIILTTHTSPDGDALGSVMALLLMIDSYNKKNMEKLTEVKTVRVVIDDRLPKYMEKFKESIFIEKYENFSLVENPDLLISLDCANEERYGRVSEIKSRSRISINIDHHISNTEHGQFNYVEDVSSTSELLYKFVGLLGVELTREMAEYLYLGIINDTGNFRHDNVTSETFSVCSRLMEAGADNHKVADIIFSMNRKKISLFGDVYKNKVIDERYGFVYYYLSAEKMKDMGLEKDDTDGIAELLLKIEDMELSLFIRDEDDVMKGSLRCNDKYDVNEIASLMGGGGHIKAAGFKTSLPLAEILERVYSRL